MKRFLLSPGDGLLAVSLLAASTALAADTLVTGTASAGTSSYTHPAKYMNDGRSTTYWAAASTAVPQIVTIDLGSAKALTASDVSWKVEECPRLPRLRQERRDRLDASSPTRTPTRSRRRTP